jgi:hypothetical protein
MNRVLRIVVFLVLVTGWGVVSVVGQAAASEKQQRHLANQITAKSKRFHSTLSRELAQSTHANSFELFHQLEAFMLLIDEVRGPYPTRLQVTQVLRRASAIERLILCTDLSFQVVRDWSILHADIDLLARITGIKWSDAVVTKELIAGFEYEATVFANNLRDGLAPAETIALVDALIEELRRPVNVTASNYSMVAGMSARFLVWRSRLAAIGRSLRDFAPSLRLQQEWRHLNSQVEELTRLINLDSDFGPSPATELVTVPGA